MRRTVLVPYGGWRADLNDLRYGWPAGFAQLVIELGHSEESLGCAIPQVMRRV